MKTCTINIAPYLHRAMKVYSSRNGESLQHAIERVINDFVVRTGDLPSREVGK